MPPKLYPLASQTVAEGSIVRLSISSIPFTGVQYQWYRDGVAIGTNKDWSFRASFASAANYHATVANDFGTTTSSVAKLTVVPKANLQHVASIKTPGLSPNCSKVFDGLLYVGDSGLQIYDVRNASNIVRLGGYGESGTVFSFAIQYPLVFAAEQDLLIIDVSNPAQPVLISRTPLEGLGSDIVVNGRTAYIATTTGLDIFDISAVDTPSRIGHYSVPNLWSLVVKDDVAFVAADTQGFQLIDVSDPKQPHLLQLIPENGIAWRVFRNKDRLYTAGHGLGVYDATNLRDIRLLGRGATSESVASLAVVGDLVLWGNSASRVFNIVDASNPEQMIILGIVPNLPANAYVIEVAGNMVFVGTGGFVDVFEWLPATNAPIVTLPLRPIIAVANRPVKLEASASGGEPLAWQWFHNETPLPNATNRTLRIPLISAEATGDYSVVARNSFGEVNIGHADVKIIDPPTLQASLCPENVAGPLVTVKLPINLQTRLEASSDLVNWEEIWRGQSSVESFELLDRNGRSARSRIYRLHFGIE